MIEYVLGYVIVIGSKTTHAVWAHTRLGRQGRHALWKSGMHVVHELLLRRLVAQGQDGTGADGTELRVRLHTQV